MANLPADLPAHLRKAGLKVVEIDGWRTRGRPASTGGFDPVGVDNHHTGASAAGWPLAKELAYAKWMFLTGRSDLPAPLCHLALGRSGTVYLGAAGRANHAGEARASGSVAAGDGNELYIGIEWMLSGTEKIPAEMRAAGVTLNAVLTEVVTGNSERTISCHYNTSVTGKWDIGDPDGVPYAGHKVLDIDKFRADVAARRKALYEPAPAQPDKPSRKIRTAALCNVPIKVGQEAWGKCWGLAARASLFGLNESFSTAQRGLYATLADQNGFDHKGLKTSGNPVFWREDRYRLFSHRIVLLHPAATGLLAKRYPGYNAERTLNETVLIDKRTDREIAVLNTHLVPNGMKVNPIWRARVRKESIKTIQRIVASHIDADRDVILMGDTNIHDQIPMPKGFRWYRGVGIDKIGGTDRGAAQTYPAPTDHKHGVYAEMFKES